MLTFETTTSQALRPRRATSESAGWDLRVPSDVSIFAGEKVSIDTGVRVRLPWGCCGRLLLRSGAFRKHRLLLQEGLIGEPDETRRTRG